MEKMQSKKEYRAGRRQVIILLLIVMGLGIAGMQKAYAGSADEQKQAWTRDNEFSFANSSKHFNTKKYTMLDADYNKLMAYVDQIGYSYEKNNITALRNDKWTGSCVGMSVAAILDYTGQIGFNENFDKGKKTMYKVSSPKSNKKVMSAINYYHMSQFVHAVRRNERAYYDEGYRLLSEGYRELVSKAQEGRIVLLGYFYRKSGDNNKYGHAIVIKGYAGTDSDGNYKLLAYDCKEPGKDTTVIISKDYSSCVINGSPKHYPCEIEITADFSLYDKIDIDGPNNDMVISYSAGLQSGAVSEAAIYVPADASLSIENKEGKTMQVSDGVITDSTMEVIDEHLIINSTEEEDVPGELAIIVEDSDSFTFSSESGGIAAAVVTDSYYSNVSAENADTASLSEEGTILNGDRVDYTITQSVAPKNSGFCDMFTCSGVTNGNADISVSGNTITINGHDGGDVLIEEFLGGYSEEFSYSSVLEQFKISLQKLKNPCVYGHMCRKVDAAEADCEKDGNTEYWFCDKCGKAYINAFDPATEIEIEDTVVKATGHDWGAWKTVKAATETKTGLKQRVCRNNKDHIEKAVIPAKGKADNPLKIRVSQKTYRRSRLTKARSFSIGASKAQGKVTYTLDKKAKKAKIKVSSKGKVTVPRKCKKGSYRITVKAAGNKKYKAAKKTVKIIVR